MPQDRGHEARQVRNLGGMVSTKGRDRIKLELTTNAAGPGSRSKASAHLYVAGGNVCGKGSASAHRGGLSRPLNPRQGACPLDPAQPCAGWMRARAFPPWTWTRKGLAP